ncbi:MAG: hypothetical protein ACR2J1_07005 [Methyloceanibacter sp.]|uniref:hypothetical protein n=1 Tax=Methyloceanibacter sp. TaxID=1965321 RepID=UPI003D9BEC24
MSATNEISVAVRGNKGTININGKKVPISRASRRKAVAFRREFGTLKQDSGPSTITLKTIQLRELEPSANRRATVSTVANGLPCACASALLLR